MLRASLVAFESKEGLILQRRTSANTVFPGMLSFLGGKIELGETPDNACRRELQEETNLNIDDLAIYRLGSAIVNAQRGASAIRMELYYCGIADADPMKLAPGEGALEVHTVEALSDRDDLVPTVRYALDIMLGEQIAFTQQLAS